MSAAGRGFRVKLESQREKAIQTFIEEHPDNIVPELRAPVLLAAEQKYLPVFKVPTSLLIYNIRNGRFAAELLAKEKDVGRDLDPVHPPDAKIIRKLLLDLNPEETKALRASIEDWGQLEEGIITSDGAVINANRRMAILEQLYEETQDPKYEYLKVARLPKGVGEKDLWRIEAGLQFAKDFKVEYKPVNELLKLREGIKSGLTSKQISKYLQGRYTEKEVGERLEVLKLVDSYLVYIGKPGEYHLFSGERKVEQFNSLRDNVIASLEREGEVPKKERSQLIQVAFPLIESGKVSYLDIRKLKPIAKDAEAMEKLLAGYTAPLKKAGKHSPDDLEVLVDSLNVAIEVTEAKGEKQKVLKNLEKALALVKSVDKKNEKLKDKAIKQVLANIAAAVETLQKAKAK